MGFCIFNNVAVGANYLIDKYKLSKIAIIDFDVHHGNGTQNIFYSNKKVLYISTHQYPHFPGTGASHEKDRTIIYLIYLYQLEQTRMSILMLMNMFLKIKSI